MRSNLLTNITLENISFQTLFPLHHFKAYILYLIDSFSQVVLARSEPAGFCCVPACSLQPESGNESGGWFCSAFGEFRPNPVGNLLEISVQIPIGIRLQGICWNTKEPTGTQRNLQERLPENEWNHRFRHPEHSTWVHID